MKRKFLAALICLTISVIVCGQQKSALKKPRPAKNLLSDLQNSTAPVLKIENSPSLQNLLARAATETVTKFAAKGLTADNFAITLIDLRDANKLTQADFRGEIKIYPASVVKLFYLAATHRWLTDGKIKDSPELQRGLHDMIVDSSNDATGYIVDVLSGVSSGAELSPPELKTWAEKRGAVQLYFDQLGYKNINVKQKAFCEDAYGREQQFRGKDGINRNKLTTNATARLLTEIVLGKAVSPKRSGEMMELLKRDWESKASDPEDQAHGFTGIALPAGAKLWSKAGWTSATRHDAAYVETPDGQKFVLVTFTENFATEREIIPNIARIVLEEIGKIK
ncbi:MAG: serine hydrolase [Pyrinomonadaceae bacterium]